MTRHAMALACAVVVCASAGVAASCAPKTVALPTNLGVGAVVSAQPLPALGRPPGDPPPLGVDEHVLLTVGDRTLGPFLARRGDALMAAYVGGGEGDATPRRVVSVPLQPSGEARSDARVVAQLASDATALIVRPSGGESAGFLLAWTALTDRGEALSVASVSDDGRPRGSAVELARTGDDIVWIEIVATPRGAICVWAEETRSGDANVLAAALSADGALRSMPNRIAHGVTGWQVVPWKDGAALALSSPGQNGPGPKGKKPGTLSWLRLDADGRPLGATIPVASPLAMSGDVDVARAGDAHVLAWTDRSEADPQVMIASVDDAGKVRGPRRAIDVSAGSSLVGVIGGPAGAMLAWDEPFKRGRAARRVSFARVDATPAVDAKGAAVLELQGRGAPELVATTDGFAVLAPVRACLAKGDASCADAPVIPTLVRFDPRLAITQVEPLRLGSVREPSTLGWGLTCGADRCVALAATNESPARVRSADLRPRASAFRSPLVPPPLPDAPHVTSVSTLASGAFADLAAARVGGGTLLAMLTAALDEPTKKGEARGATLSIRAVDGRAAAGRDKAVALSTRALTVGGVAIAGGGRVEDGAAVAWVAPEGGDPQVHVTRVDARGVRMNDVQLTTAKGDASDVAIAWAGDGWVVAWVDGRDGNGEVYATKVDRELRRVAREERITRAPGDASDVALLARPDAVWVAWADPRESPTEGFADVYVAPLRPSDAALAGEEVRVLPTAAHSRSPALASTGDQLAVAWIEEAPMGADPATSPAYGAMLAWLDPHGRPLHEPGHLATAGDGFPTAIALDGLPTSLHVILARSAHDAVELDALEITRAPSPRTYPLLGLDGPPSLDVAVGLLGDALYFNDEGQDASDRRARRASLVWRH